VHEASKIRKESNDEEYEFVLRKDQALGSGRTRRKIQLGARTIAVFFAAAKYSTENAAYVLKRRTCALPVPIRRCCSIDLAFSDRVAKHPSESRT
jgi:hypothetical protein